MTVAGSFPDSEGVAGLRERRCIVTGEVLSEAMLVRFVVGPDGEIVPDIAAKLPGRGLWVRADRESVDRAVAKKLFSRAAKAPVEIGANLAVRVEALLAARMAGDLGLARRSGQIVLGFDNVLRAFGDRKPPAALVEASDAAEDGTRKLLAGAAARGLTPIVINCLANAELSLALGRENVVHAALKSGRLSDRLIVESGRLHGFRPSTRSIGLGKAAGPVPAQNEGQE